jgi:hypothetical protein
LAYPGFDIRDVFRTHRWRTDIRMATKTKRVMFEVCEKACACSVPPGVSCLSLSTVDVCISVSCGVMSPKTRFYPPGLLYCKILSNSSCKILSNSIWLGFVLAHIYLVGAVSTLDRVKTEGARRRFLG